MNDTALQTDELISDKGEGYDIGLHKRFLDWMSYSGDSVGKIARKLKRGENAVCKYIELEYEGNTAAIEEDIRNYLRREEDSKFIIGSDVFCNISPSKLIWETLQFCEENHKMGAVIAASGFSKTTTANEYKRRNPGVTLITADVTKRSLGAVLTLIAYQECSRYHIPNAELLNSIIDDLKWSKKLIIIDESHFLSWEAFEAIKTVHDSAGNGIVYLGMPRLYSQMRGNKAYLWDQVLSRITVQRSITNMAKNDIQLISESIHPGLPKNCIEFLYQKALGPGKLRIVGELLHRAVHVHNAEKVPLNLQLLKAVNNFLTF